MKFLSDEMERARMCLSLAAALGSLLVIRFFIENNVMSVQYSDYMEMYEQ